MSNIEINENNKESELSSKQKLDILKKEVYQSISKEFNISSETAEKLTNLKKETWLNDFNSLKNEIEKNQKIDTNDRAQILSLTSDRLENLYKAISGAEKLNKKELLDTIDIIQIGQKSSLSKKLFPKLYEKAVNPENTTDQVLGFCLGGLDSCSTTIKFLFDLGSGITLSPHHTFMIISGKGQYKAISRKVFILSLIGSIFGIGYIMYYIFFR